MPKYYVSSSNFRKAIDRNTPREAARDAIKDTIETLGAVVEVSETGFDFKPEEGIFFSTGSLLNEIDKNKVDM